MYPDRSPLYFAGCTYTHRLYIPLARAHLREGLGDGINCRKRADGQSQEPAPRSDFFLPARATSALARPLSPAAVQPHPTRPALQLLQSGSFRNCMSSRIAALGDVISLLRFRLRKGTEGILLPKPLRWGDQASRVSVVKNPHSRSSMRLDLCRSYMRASGRRLSGSGGRGKRVWEGPVKNIPSSFRRPQTRLPLISTRFKGCIESLT